MTLPDNFSYCFSDYCEECDKSELYLEEVYIDGFFGDDKTEYTLKCKHRDACRRMCGMQTLCKDVPK